MNEIRYRTESYSGSGVRDAASIIAFECVELQNNDILETLISSGYIKNDILRQEMKDLVALNDGTKDEYEVPQSIADLYGCENDEDVQFAERILAEVNKNTGKNIRYALWLADYDIVAGRDQQSGDYGYDMGENPDTDAYEVSDIVLSECDPDGTLYGYESYPRPVASNLTTLYEQK